jgi:phenylacetate-CoA ligase
MDRLGPSASSLSDILRQLLADLERSQWEPAARLSHMQHRQVVRLAGFCADHSPGFAARLAGSGLTPGDLGSPEGLARLPVLTRRDIQTLGDRLFCRDVPAPHAAVGVTRTSGSTGEPVVIRRTPVTRLFWEAMALRDFAWHADDLMWRACSVRPGIAAPAVQPSWGRPADLVAETGPMLALPITTGVAELVSRMRDFAPQLLLVYPNTLAALATYCERHAITIASLVQIRTISETLSVSTRRLAERVFAATVVDTYSSQEIGYIALQCPDSGLYHPVSETVLAEVIDAAGRPCAPGMVGRVVVTDLHNFATPLIRYAIGDLAEASEACPCGRGLPTWRRIAGRERNLIRLPDGTRHWPVIGLRECRDVAPVLQFQVVQREADRVELRLVVERPLSDAEESALCRRVREHLGPFTVTVSYLQGRIPAGANGKFEEFVCAV